VVWRLALADTVGAPEEWLDFTAFGAAPDVLHYLNGIVPTPSGETLIVAAQGTGVLWRIDLATATPAPIDLDVRVNGDVLVFVGDVLYICDNTDEPDGSARYWLTAIGLSADAGRGELLGRWERPTADTPTTVGYLDGRLYLVNSQFAGRAGGTARAPFTVEALPPPL
jgi:Cu-Zn family superoxide dismutase